MAAVIPTMDPRPLRTMADMGMGMGMGMGSMNMGSGSNTLGQMSGRKMDGMSGMDMCGVKGVDMLAAPKMQNAMQGMKMEGMPGMDHGAMPGGSPDLQRSVEVDSVAMAPAYRMGEPGLDPNRRRVLAYSDLRRESQATTCARRRGRSRFISPATCSASSGAAGHHRASDLYRIGGYPI